MDDDGVHQSWDNLWIVRESQSPELVPIDTVLEYEFANEVESQFGTGSWLSDVAHQAANENDSLASPHTERWNVISVPDSIENRRFSSEAILKHFDKAHPVFVLTSPLLSGSRDNANEDADWAVDLREQFIQAYVSLIHNHSQHDYDSGHEESVEGDR